MTKPKMIRELVDGYVDGLLAEEQVARLQAILINKPPACRPP